jgi:hypothetical protein
VRLADVTAAQNADVSCHRPPPLKDAAFSVRDARGAGRDSRVAPGFPSPPSIERAG